MFAVRVSYLAILREVALSCCLPYISTVHEILQDGASLYGIELEFPALQCSVRSQTYFFWANSGMERSAAYEAAALQVLLALQQIYGFVVLDYNMHGLMLYRTLAQRLLPVANRGVQLARLVIGSQQRGVQYDPTLVASA